MKRMFILFLSAILVFLCVGCAAQENHPSFYFLWSDHENAVENGSIAPEIQDDIEAGYSLKYLLTLYLNGPLDSRMVSPFPAGLKLNSVERNDKYLILDFSPELAELTGYELTLACACITQTCLELTDARVISIRASGELLHNRKVLEFTRDDFALQDFDKINTGEIE